MSINMTRNFFVGVTFCGIAYKYQSTKQPEEPWKAKLKLNLMYAEEAVRYTNEVLPEGALNYRDDLSGISIESLKKLKAQRKEAGRIFREEVQCYDLEDKAIAITATVAKKYKMGNCGEQAAVAYTYLKQEKNLRKIDLLVLVNGDHAFVVIGKDPLVEVNDLHKWGKAAVVCETWGKTYFPAEQLFEKLNQISEKTLYDPSKHTIGCIKNGDVPPEVNVRKWIRRNQQTQKQFAKINLKIFKDQQNDEGKLITNCLKEYIEKKSKPKAPPKLSKEELERVDKVYFQYLSEKRQ